MYWDTYWNDGFIKDELFVEANATANSLTELSYANSPGVSNFIYGFDLSIDNISNEYSPMINEMYGYIEMNSSPYKSMLSCLVDVYENNGMSFRNVLIGGTTFNKFYNGLASKYFESNNVTFSNDYFNSNFDVFYGYSPSIYEFEDYREEVIMFVEQGYPVIVGMYDASTNSLESGHFCVVYDYNEITGSLYAFTDFENSQNQVELNKHYEISSNVTIGDYYVICPKSYQSHTHSRNYFVHDLETNDYVGYCHCELSIHEHNIIQEYPDVFNASICYRERCYCGLNEVYSHDYYVEGNKHFCSICGSNGKHMGLFVPNNNFTCRGTCEICLISVTIAHEWQINGDVKCCRLCGRYSTVIAPILKKEEEEEYE